MLALFALATFVEVTAYGQLSAFTPLHLPRIGVSDADVPLWVGLLTAFANVLGMLFLPFWGALADRFGRKPLIIRSFVATGSGLVIAALATNVWGFLAARALTALNLGNSGLMMTTLHEAAPAARLGLAFGIVNGAGPLGAFIGPLVGGPLVDRYGFAALLAVDAVLLLAVVVMLSVGYRDPYQRPADPPPLLRSALGGLALLWRSPRLRWLMPALLVTFAGWLLLFTYLPLVVAKIYTGPEVATAVGIVFGAGGFVTLVASPGIGALADRLGIVRTFFTIGIVGALLWLVPYGIRDYWPFVVAFAVVNGIGSGVFSLSFNILSDSTTAASRARVMTFAYLPLNLGFVLGPLVGSVVAAEDPTGIFPAAVVLQLAGLGLVALALRRPV